MNKERIKIISIAVICLLIVAAVAGVIIKTSGGDPGEGANVSGAPSTVSNTVAAEITIKDDGFVPQTITVKAGTPVTWTSHDDEYNHNIMSDPHPDHSGEPSLKSDVLKDDDVYTYMFEKPGTYNYHDEIHPELNGTVIVTQ